MGCEQLATDYAARRGGLPCNGNRFRQAVLDAHGRLVTAATGACRDTVCDGSEHRHVLSGAGTAVPVQF